MLKMAAEHRSRPGVACNCGSVLIDPTKAILTPAARQSGNVAHKVHLRHAAPNGCDAGRPSATGLRRSHPCQTAPGRHERPCMCRAGHRLCHLSQARHQARDPGRRLHDSTGPRKPPGLKPPFPAGRRATRANRYRFRTLFSEEEAPRHTDGKANTPPVDP